MMIDRSVWIGAMAVTVTGACLAQTSLIEFPMERQVFQRDGEDWGEVKVSGTCPKDAALVEAKATLSAGLRGKAPEWTVAAQGERVKDGRFGGSLRLETGGWYTLTLRFRRSAGDPTSLAEATVERVGVGDTFVTAGQSNSVNYGHPRQKSAEPLSVYFDGRKFTPADSGTAAHSITHAAASG